MLKFALPLTDHWGDEILRYDIVDFTRSALSSLFSAGIHDVLTSCAKTGLLVDKCGPFSSDCVFHLKNVLNDLNLVLGCSKPFIFGVEEQAALKSGAHDVKTTILNVRNQRTMWGPCKYLFLISHYNDSLTQPLKSTTMQSGITMV